MVGSSTRSQCEGARERASEEGAERERERERQKLHLLVEHYFLHPLTSELAVWPNNYKSLAEKQKVR